MPDTTKIYFENLSPELQEQVLLNYGATLFEDLIKDKIANWVAKLNTTLGYLPGVDGVAEFVPYETTDDEGLPFIIRLEVDAEASTDLMMLGGHMDITKFERESDNKVVAHVFKPWNEMLSKLRDAHYQMYQLGVKSTADITDEMLDVLGDIVDDGVADVSTNATDLVAKIIENIWPLSDSDRKEIIDTFHEAKIYFDEEGNIFVEK